MSRREETHSWDIRAPIPTIVHVAHNGIYKGYAWSGVTNASGRSTGTYTVALFMNAGDYLQTFAASQNGRKRHLGQFNLTGYMVKSAY